MKKKINNTKDTNEITLNLNKKHIYANKFKNSLFYSKFQNKKNEFKFMTDNLLEAIHNIYHSVKEHISFSENIKKMIDNQSNVSSSITMISNDLKDISKKNLDLIDEGWNKIVESQKYNDEIKNSISNISLCMDDLIVRINQITEISESIKAITVQVNMLSLNAAIEAGRAGSVGNGFSIISNEIKNLSSNIDSLSLDIVNNIQYILNGVHDTKASVNKSIDKILAGVEISNSIGEKFSKIKESCETTSNNIDSIVNKIIIQDKDFKEMTSFVNSMGELSKNALNAIEFEIMNINNLMDITRGMNDDLTFYKNLENKEKSNQLINRDPILNILITSQATSLDPVEALSIENTKILSNAHSSLFSIGNNNAILPSIANKWVLSPDGQTWFINIRNDVYFHDGSLLTIDDVIFSLLRIFKNNASDYYLINIKGAQEYIDNKCSFVSGIKKINNFQMSISLNILTPNFLYGLSSVVSSIISKKAFENGKIIGCGPYTLDIVDSKYIFTAFDRYFGASPGIKKVICSTPEAYKESESLNLSDFEILELNQTVDSLLNKQELSGYTTSNFLSLGMKILFINYNRKGILQSSSEYRKAINLAIDKSKISSIISGKDDTATDSFFPKTSNINIVRKSTNKEEAIKILKEAGLYNSGEVIHILCRANSEVSKNVAKQICSDLNEIGIKTRLDELKDDEFNENTFDSYDMYMIEWLSNIDDLDDFLTTIIDPNRNSICAYSNEKIYNLLLKSKNTVNPNKRIEIFTKINNILEEEQAYIPLCFSENHILHKNNILGLNVSPSETIKFNEVIICDTI